MRRSCHKLVCTCMGIYRVRALLTLPSSFRTPTGLIEELFDARLATLMLEGARRIGFLADICALYHTHMPKHMC